MNENINIEKLELGGQTATLNVLHGELPTQPPIEYKKPISIKGAITSPANYVQAHKDHGIFDVKTSRVEFSYNSGAIYFIFNEDSSLTESFVKGSVTDNPDFLRLDINGSKTYTGKELYRALREATMYFVKPSLVNEFAFIDKDIAAKINADSELSNNGKGNSAIKSMTIMKKLRSY